jgi:hypothetical protein
MSYAAAAALQSAVFARLTGFPAMAGVAVVDAVAPGAGKGQFVLLGPETATDKSDKSGSGAEHLFQVAVISDDTGFLSAKVIAGHVSDALLGGGLTLATGHLVYLTFVRAVARRLKEGDHRRIDLTFRARVDF